MEKIASFTIDHIKLEPGVYVSRKDHIGSEVITTFDLRMTSPNDEPVMNTAEMHTIEHLAATFLRNHPIFKDKTIYFGPMGCATGFYLLVRNSNHTETLNAVLVVLQQIINHKGEVFGNSEIECGNYKTLCLEKAVYDTDGIAVVRYPKGTENTSFPAEAVTSFSINGNNGKRLAISYGRVVHNLCSAEECDIMKLVKIWPIEQNIIDLCMNYREIYFFEEGAGSTYHSS